MGRAHQRSPGAAAQLAESAVLAVSQIGTAWPPRSLLLVASSPRADPLGARLLHALGRRALARTLERGFGRGSHRQPVPKPPMCQLPTRRRQAQFEQQQLEGRARQLELCGPSGSSRLELLGDRRPRPSCRPWWRRAQWWQAPARAARRTRHSGGRRVAARVIAREWMQCQRLQRHVSRLEWRSVPKMLSVPNVVCRDWSGEVFRRC